MNKSVAEIKKDKWRIKDALCKSVGLVFSSQCVLVSGMGVETVCTPSYIRLKRPGLPVICSQNQQKNSATVVNSKKRYQDEFHLLFERAWPTNQKSRGTSVKILTQPLARGTCQKSSILCDYRSIHV